MRIPLSLLPRLLLAIILCYIYILGGPKRKTRKRYFLPDHLDLDCGTVFHPKSLAFKKLFKFKSDPNAVIAGLRQGNDTQITYRLKHIQLLEAEELLQLRLFSFFLRRSRLSPGLRAHSLRESCAGFRGFKGEQSLVPLPSFRHLSASKYLRYCRR